MPGRSSALRAAKVNHRKNFDTPIVPSQEHFLLLPDQQVTQWREFSELGVGNDAVSRFDGIREPIGVRRLAVGRDDLSLVGS